MQSTNYQFRYHHQLPDASEELRIHLLWYLLARIITFTLLLGITVIIQSKAHNNILPPHGIILGFISIIYIYTIGSAAILQKIDVRLRRFGAYQVTLDCIASAFLVYATGCSQSIFTPVFILPIIAGGLILYRIGGLIPATASTLLYATLLTLEFFNILPSYYSNSNYIALLDPLASMNIFSVYGLIFFLAGLLSGFLGYRLQSAEDALSFTTRQLDKLSSLYQQIFNDISTGIITIDSTEKITSCNPAAESITGFKRNEIIGQQLTHRFPGISKIVDGRRVGSLQKKNGEPGRVIYSFSSLQLGGESPKDLWKIITIEDITKIEELEKQIMEARNKAAIGELSANIAHDFRNPLAAIYGSAQIMSLEFENSNIDLEITQQKLIKIILRESERMANTITEFLQFARPDAPQPNWFDFRRLSEEIILEFEEKGLTKGVKILIRIKENFDVWGDREQLKIVLQHILINSLNASSNTSKPIYINGREENRDDRGALLIQIIDHGSGIKPEVQEKIFDPFYSTHEDGTGLGLAIVKQIIELHHGTLDILCKEDKGTVVSLHLPLPTTMY